MVATPREKSSSRRRGRDEVGAVLVVVVAPLSCQLAESWRDCSVYAREALALVRPIKSVAAAALEACGGAGASNRRRRGGV